MPQLSSTDKAPSTDESTGDHSNTWGSLRHPGEATPMRKGTPAPAPAPALSSADYICLAVAQKHVPTHTAVSQHSYVKHSLACFGNFAISHAQITGELGPGAFTPVI